MKKLIEQTQFWSAVTFIIIFLSGLFIGYEEYVAAGVCIVATVALAVWLDLLYKHIGRFL